MKKAVVHFEIGCNDIQKAVVFYRNVFGWNIKQIGNSAIIETGIENAIPGHINQLGAKEPQKYVTIYIETGSLEKDLEIVEKNGGKILVQPISLPDGRKFAWIEDVAENIIGLISPFQSDNN